MIQSSVRIALALLLSGATFGQSPAVPPAFEIADVHAGAHVRNRSVQGGVLREGRYEIRRATMLDLIKTAYGVDSDTVVGGPSWLEWDRFDVSAKAPANTSPQTVKLMVRGLLADRFKLVVHRDTRPIQGFVLSTGKGKPKMKEADPSGDSGCQFQPQPPARPGFDPPVVVSCRNVTMAEFAVTLRGLDSRYLTGPLADQTELRGGWDLDLRWTDKRNLPYAGGDGVTIFDAVDRQLGLKLEPGKVPMPVLVVDRVNERPTANSPEVTTLLPPLPAPEFEVASIRPRLPDTRPGAGGGFMPGGRVDWRGLPLALLIRMVWDPSFDPGESEQIPGAPKWLEPFEPTFDLIAKAPARSIVNDTELFNDDYVLMIRALLLDRFKLKFHYEDRPMDAYTLVAVKPKLKKADSSIRTGCKTEPAPRSDPDSPRLTVATCRNLTMAQFAEELSDLSTNYLHYPAVDATGLTARGTLASPLTQSLRASSPSPPARADPGRASRRAARSRECLQPPPAASRSLRHWKSNWG
jgi:uncharacterized protein (TIGR03435 family)